jgi:putative endonuclease
MESPRQTFGKKAEEAAVDHLKRRGYRILEKNYRTPLGEIDIVAMDGDTLVFVEVKAKKTGRFGHPKEAVTAAKQRRISMAALVYLKSVGKVEHRARFDVVTLHGSLSAPAAEIVRNAFDLAYP